jgi:hypothetical protein
VDAITLFVAAQPPSRHDPGRCADRTSPNAWPLFQAANALVSDQPSRFPITTRVGIVVASSEPLPAHDGYGPLDAIIEVLVDAGLLADERLVETERREATGTTTGYEVTVGAPAA